MQFSSAMPIVLTEVEYVTHYINRNLKSAIVDLQCFCYLDFGLYFQLNPDGPMFEFNLFFNGKKVLFFTFRFCFYFCTIVTRHLFVIDDDLEMKQGVNLN